MNIADSDAALIPVPLTDIRGNGKYDDAERLFQGIPTIEKTPGGTLWAAFYGGGDNEGPNNYVLIVTSDDNGRTWSSPTWAIDPPGLVRAFDPCLWVDPLGRLWLFWAQSFGETIFDGRCGVWASVCGNPDAAQPEWGLPRRIAHGIMMNKPTVLSSGEWLLPSAVWSCMSSSLHSLPEERFSQVLASADQGESFNKRGHADVPNRHFDEHMIVERKDGSLWMLVRTYYGIGESVSEDGGLTWSPGKPTRLGGPSSRFFIRRLRSGRLLLVNHYGYRGRSHLTAQLSEDDGLTWSEGLLLDERSDISYPDGTEDAAGCIYIIYDRERYKEKQILMAVFTEEDVLAECCVSEAARLKVLVHQAGVLREK
ncbi:glycoside hydrolase [Paenibacillus sp. J5C_2022]|uniref:sialidase family protein n=1 Tax=Paenibacillus sp. J5C2022 TaxID=2977129 RepID=UPI0021CEC946|nr:sialidase family protein [Paenibacillus sp. J5C2022]MCU6709953.1 glycoside hydrolase [Paenibacillus sp. J5C2022]